MNYELIKSIMENFIDRQQPFTALEIFTFIRNTSDSPIHYEEVKQTISENYYFYEEELLCDNIILEIIIQNETFEVLDKIYYFNSDFKKDKYKRKFILNMLK